MKFLVDRCAGQRIANRLRQLGHDVVDSRERDPDPGDAQILEWAVEEGRVLITMDKDFGALVFAQGASHSGIIRLPDIRSDQRIQLLETLLSRHDPEELEGSIVTVRGNRIRFSSNA